LITGKFVGESFMKLPRRQFLQLAAGAAALPVMERGARAQAYPARPVHIIVGGPAGGTLDIVARVMGQWLSERLGQPFVIDNRPGGAGNNVATEAVMRARPDGYTFLLVALSNALNTTLFENLNYNFLRDIAPVSGIVRVPLVMEVNQAVPARTVPEFIAYARTNSGKVNMASAGNGTSPQLAGELFKLMTGVELTHVPYRGSPSALTDMLGGQIQVMFDLMPSSIELIRAGKLRALAVTTATRSPALPDVPTVGEIVPGYEASTWQGLGAPKDTPAEIVDRLNREINAGLADPKVKARFADLGATPFIGSPGDFGKFMAEETEKWAKVIKFANIKGE
jgi:tripartite-type tricarboxylate transporter receptor subunit TctC